jgi:ribosome-associated protein
MPLRITDEISFQFIPSTGPGGQNVNKVATTAVLKFNIMQSGVLTETQRERLVSLAGKKVDKQGVLTIIARRYRSQEQNRKDAVERLKRMVDQVNKIRKKRHSTRPSYSSVQNRLEAKKHRSQLKQNRKTDGLSD